jgi:GTP-binding protein EngB required for normal cell division
MFKFLGEFGIPLIIVLNKIDRLSNNEINKSVSYTQQIFFGQKIMTVSAKNNIGIEELKKELMESFK